MSNPKESEFAASFARKLIQDQFTYAEEPAEPSRQRREWRIKAIVEMGKIALSRRFSKPQSPAGQLVHRF